MGGGEVFPYVAIWGSVVCMVVFVLFSKQGT